MHETEGVKNMNVPSNIFREYDIRGIADTELNSSVVTMIGKAFGTYLREKGVAKVSIGGDVRFSTERIKQDMISGITFAGINVFDIGTVTSPILYWSLFHLELEGGVMITGSHNPKDMNGL